VNGGREGRSADQHDELAGPVDRARLERLEQVRVRVEVSAAVVSQIDDHATRLRPAREAQQPVRHLVDVGEHGVVDEVDDAAAVERRHRHRRAALLDEQRLRSPRHPVEEPRVGRPDRGLVRGERHRRQLGVRRAGAVLDGERRGRRRRRDAEPVQELGVHEREVPMRRERERIVGRDEWVDEPQDVVERAAVDRDEPATDELRPTRRGRHVDAVGEAVRDDRVVVERPAPGHRAEARVTVSLSEERDEPHQLDRELVVRERRESRHDPVRRGAVLGLRDRVVGVRMDALQLGDVAV
jgi:hypothetical protein